MDEAREINGNFSPPNVYVQACLKKYSMAAVTDGRNGLCLGFSQQTVHAKYNLNYIIISAGSGDCITAGIVSAWHQTNDLINTAKNGVACGAANCIPKELGMVFNHDVVDIK